MTSSSSSYRLVLFLASVFLWVSVVDAASNRRRRKKSAEKHRLSEYERYLDRLGLTSSSWEDEDYGWGAIASMPSRMKGPKEPSQDYGFLSATDFDGGKGVLVGLLDGHGPKGRRVSAKGSQICLRSFKGTTGPALLSAQINHPRGFVRAKQPMVRLFEEVQAGVRHFSSGSTMTTIALTKTQGKEPRYRLHSAGIGDSGAILIKVEPASPNQRSTSGPAPHGLFGRLPSDSDVPDPPSRTTSSDSRVRWVRRLTDSDNVQEHRAQHYIERKASELGLRATPDREAGGLRKKLIPVGGGGGKTRGRQFGFDDSYIYVSVKDSERGLAMVASLGDRDFDPILRRKPRLGTVKVLDLRRSSKFDLIIVTASDGLWDPIEIAHGKGGGTTTPFKALAHVIAQHPTNPQDIAEWMVLQASLFPPHDDVTVVVQWLEGFDVA